jgi:DNA-binding NarL/FixJ family response regulator
MPLISDCELVQHLANGSTIMKVSEETKINRRTLESRIVILKSRVKCNTHAELVAYFFSKNLITYIQKP